MSRCERCGYDSSHHVAICPVCGSLTTASGDYTPAGGPETPGSTGEPFSYYSTSGWPGSSPGSRADPWPQQASLSPTPYSPPQQVNVMVVQPQKEVAPLIVELLLSLLLNIYGIGWLMVGETLPGVLLLVGSIVVLWPLLLVSLIFWPVCCGFKLLLIVGLVINSVLLNNYLDRLAARRLMPVPPPPMPPPPQRQW
ncbi:MAG: hypothetical protein IRZ31_03355 [Thermogemmatispora sp.]|uniref:hypothetical protein n=1 Tax=Thermogemmatispora sp. TaxID=1968838 RepID=UPI0026335F48|nr:hypothetical protein [Thermogemmatispora sp.]MBX5455914.1 hypothetical protein [Thermogemmatispora sp.]